MIFLDSIKERSYSINLSTSPIWRGCWVLSRKFKLLNCLLLVTKLLILLKIFKSRVIVSCFYGHKVHLEVEKHLLYYTLTLIVVKRINCFDLIKCIYIGKNDVKWLIFTERNYDIYKNVIFRTYSLGTVFQDKTSMIPVKYVGLFTYVRTSMMVR